MTERRLPAALTIAGSDSSGGAGLQADLKTFTALGVYGASVVTAVTAQNTLGVQGVSTLDAAFVAKQLNSVLADLRVTAAKTGMLATRAIVEVVAARWGTLSGIPLVVDPVMVATSGDALLDHAAIEAYRHALVPRATLLTPNLPEAAKLLGEAEAINVDDCARHALALRAFGASAVLVKGGHLDGAEVVDVLADAGGVQVYRHLRIATLNTHGTGCTLSAAIVAALSAGIELRAAIGCSVQFLERALKSGAGQHIGAGHGPVDHVFNLRK